MANLIFDYDGTIHNCLKIYAPAFRKAYGWLVENGYSMPKDHTDTEISYWLGFNSADMWSMFQPQLSQEIKDKCRRMIGSEMNRCVSCGEAELFSGTEEVLNRLRSQGHTLIFLSNCRRRYMEVHSAAFGLDRFFHFFYCCEDYDFLPKYEIFRKIKPLHKGEFIVIGDRFHDIETAVKNELKSIGCGYGYGSEQELADADIIVNSIQEIPNAVNKLIGHL